MSIELSQVKFAYKGKEIFDGLNFSVREGMRVGILGESGCGKSTLIKLLAGLYPPDAGSMTVSGADTAEGIRKNVALVMQSAPLLPASILENITCGHDLPKEAILQAAEAAQLTDWIATLPDGLDTFVGERGGKVSGGQAQRIAIARAIAKNAPVILLDEATSALDVSTRSAVLVALHSLIAEKTVVSVSHQTEAFEGFDAVFRMEGGRLYAA